MAESVQRFKVIIAGGSLAGLTAALALERAGVDFLLLEKREIAPHMGASIGMHPHIQRVMEQLGVWPELRSAVIPLVDRQHYDEYGHLFEDSAVLREISKMSLGRATTFMERRFWLGCVYNQIRDKSRVRGQDGVATFVETDDGVEVTTDSGEIVKGDLLLGADGIHSAVRRILADRIDSTDTAAARHMREGFESTYDCIFATSRNGRSDSEPKQFLPDGMVHNVYYHGFSGVAAVGVSGLVFWFMFVKSDRITKTPNTPRFTEEQTEATITKYGHHNLGPGYTFKNLWDARVKAAMLPLEEGVLQTKWNSGSRAVLIGDSVHKATINPGFGGNLAVEGVVHLVNELVPLIRRSEADGGRKPTKSELVRAFGEYEKKQRPHANIVVTMSGYVTRYDAMETWWLRILRRISPWIGDRAKANRLVSYMQEAPLLNFLPNPDEKGIRN